MIIGREKEASILNKLYRSNKPEFVAIHGRRRVGKTFLISELFDGKFSFKHTGLSPVEEKASSSEYKEQLTHFYRSLIKSGMKQKKQPKNWLEAFYMLEDYLDEIDNGSRQLVFIDEIQWLDSSKSGFVTALEAFWNGWASYKHNIMLIVCGSSNSWILNKLVNNKGGLYNRLTYCLKISAFNLNKCEEYFEKNSFTISKYDITQNYMIYGGIPYYLNYLDKSLSVQQNVNKIFFENNAPLKGEFDRLFDSTFNNSERIKKIIRALFKKRIGLTRLEIIKETEIPNGGDLTKLIDALIESDFVLKYSPFKKARNEEYYKLVDPFCLFYLQFVDKKNDSTKMMDFESQAVISWRGYAFENVCFKHIDQIKEALGIAGVISNEYVWIKKKDNEESGTQVDMLIERNDNVINMCEIKFYNDEFVINKNYHLLLNERKNIILNELKKKTASIQPVLISTYGIKRNEYSFDFQKVIILDDLFK